MSATELARRVSELSPRDHVAMMDIDAMPRRWRDEYGTGWWMSALTKLIALGWIEVETDWSQGYERPLIRRAKRSVYHQALWAARGAARVQ